MSKRSASNAPVAVAKKAKVDSNDELMIASPTFALPEPHSGKRYQLKRDPKKQFTAGNVVHKITWCPELHYFSVDPVDVDPQFNPFSDLSKTIYMRYLDFKEKFERVPEHDEEDPPLPVVLKS